MNRENVIRLVKRHAATVPWHPYTQGHLYLIHTMALVLHDEMSLYWGYTRICRIIHPYGPDTPYETNVIPDYVYDVISDTIDVERDLFDVVLRMRWVYVIFGQTFPTSSGICAVWDYILRDFSNMYRVCAALLRHAIDNEPEVDAGVCDLERFSEFASIKIESDTDVAGIIACAQAITTV